ncbi:MAG: 7-cyano-7-deazaguanine/7-aminomethyl-7-deazaguanine transporter [Gammaproteobacteria bacterium]|nr:7-cyano-7-deazaguanine/7-aminomethyl-7-deazaguanine transporter [Gammaproteobacteria bacterium]
MNTLTVAQAKKAMTFLVISHLLIIAASNYLVQLPFTLFGFHTTWGAFSFPFIFLATDLTVRLFGAQMARRIIFRVMFPALILSYVLSVLFYEGAFQSFGDLAELNLFVARIALASFIAYGFGQFLDIKVFSKLRRNRHWWVAPAASTVLGNALDTLLFFSIAFYQSTDTFMAENWVEIALVDYAFKLTISLLLFLPAYAVLLNSLAGRLTETAEELNALPANN